MIKYICINLEWEVTDVLSQNPELTEEQASNVLKLMEIRTDHLIDEGWYLMSECVSELFG